MAPLIGRATELTVIRTRLLDPACRLLTLVGVGGSGKTRLALAAATNLLSEIEAGHFEHGLFFVSLAPIQTAEALVSLVAQTLGFAFYEPDNPQQQLLAYLRRKNLLLILDNFEHLLPPSEETSAGALEFVTEILRDAPAVKILVTSRTRLNLQGETLSAVSSMRYPDSSTDLSSADLVQYGAVRLFLETAQRVQPDYTPSNDDLAAIVRICGQVQGLPLGILLAASWASMLTVTEILGQISDQSLDFLAIDWPDVPKRQRSMRAVFDHSWRLLTQRERQVFRGLAVFRGGFTWPAVQQVTGASLPELLALHNKSLLQRTPLGRYELHELLRQFAAEKLDQFPDESQATHDRHAAYYADTLQDWAATLHGARQQTVLKEIETDLENARVAWQWAVAHQQITCLERAVDGLCRFYEWRWRYQEGEAACRLATNKLKSIREQDYNLLPADSKDDTRRILAKILIWQGFFTRTLGETEPARQLLAQSLALLNDLGQANQDVRQEKAAALHQMGELVDTTSHFEAAEKRYRQSLTLYQAQNDRWGTAEVLIKLGRVAKSLDNYTRSGASSPLQTLPSPAPRIAFRGKFFPFFIRIIFPLFIRILSNDYWGGLHVALLRP